MKFQVSNLGYAMVAAIAVFAAGCTETNTAPGPGDAVLHDPMNYKSSADDFPDVSGGGIGNFDKKGFHRDVDSVLNP